MKSYDITIISPINGKEVTMLDISADRLIDRDGETWFKYDHTCGWFNPETRQEEFRIVEVITAKPISDEAQAAKAAYFARYGTANE